MDSQGQNVQSTDTVDTAKGKVRGYSENLGFLWMLHCWSEQQLDTFAVHREGGASERGDGGAHPFALFIVSQLINNQPFVEITLTDGFAFFLRGRGFRPQLQTHPSTN